MILCAMVFMLLHSEGQRVQLLRVSIKSQCREGGLVAILLACKSIET